MPNAIIADTSCFILLANIEELTLLQQVYGQLLTTSDVAAEYGEALPAWVQIVPVTDKYRQQLLEIHLDKGESSAIALALELPGSTVILDDYKARQTAERLGIPITGTIGIIVKAKLKWVIPSVKPLLAKIEQTNFRLSADLEAQALRAANEETS